MDGLPHSSCAHYISKHVYLPGKLPQQCDYSAESESALATSVKIAAEEFSQLVPFVMQSRWAGAVDLLSNLVRSSATSTLREEEVIQQLQGMTKPGDIRVFLIRMQNAAVIVRRQVDATIFESFEVSPSPKAVLAAKGRLHCTYPGPAVSFPNTEMDTGNFAGELGHFLAFMDGHAFEDAAPKAEKAKSRVREDRDNAHPRYITELLTGILLGCGEVVDVPRICKRVRDEALCLDADLPWRRSSLWLVIRVALQTTLERHPGGAALYKSFILFFQTRFLKCLIGSGEVVDSFDSDTLSCMSAKISRRAHKLEQSDLHPVDGVLSLVLSAAQDVKAFLERRYAALLRPPLPLPPVRVSVADLERDKVLSLTKSGPFIERALTLGGRGSAIGFKPSHPMRSHDFAVLAVQLEKFLGDCPDEEEKKIILVDFEHVVARFEDVDTFCTGRSADDACAVLNECIQVYHRTASTCYDGDPVNMSIMFLTSLLLWTALDRRMLEECAILWEYRPDIELGIFDALLLRDETQRDLLSMARDHLADRLKKSMYRGVLTQPIDSDCFPARFFDASRSLQELKSRIEGDATLERERTIKELERKRVEHADHLAAASRLSHDRDQRNRCSRGCSRCSHEAKAANLSIDVHEWPLPQDDAEAKACVFEVGCPSSFGAWRDATHYASSHIFAISRPEEKRGDWYGLLSGPVRPYPPLVRYRPSSSPSSRIVTLGSSEKSFVKSQYSSKHLSENPGIDEICVNNGLTMQFVDRDRFIATRRLVSTQGILAPCTYRLPAGSYARSNLDVALAHTTHTSNEVLARQSDCDAKLSIHEFYEFGTLRSGPRIQWLNLLRQLRSQSLDFKEEAVYLLVTQTVLQVGDRDGSWHTPLSDHGFCAELLVELRRIMDDIQANCLQVFALRIVIEILQRLLSRARDSTTLVRIYSQIRCARGIVFAWVKAACEEDTTQDDIHARIRTMSAVCLLTFDAEASHFHELFQSSDDVEVFVRCATYLFDNTPSSLPAEDQRVVDRTRRILVRMESRLTYLITRSRDGLDAGIKAVWPGYEPDSAHNWAPLSGTSARWMAGRSSQEDGRMSLTIHYNLLTGSLLVNGQSTGRLPPAIAGHLTYSQLFGGKILDVLPATVPGMQYMTSTLKNNHQVFFGIHGGDLFIMTKRFHAENHSEETFCLIPRQILEGDLPSAFVQGHQHWLNLSSQEIFIQSDQKVIDTNRTHWSIAYASREMTRIIDSTSEVEHMLDVRSPTAKTLSRYFEVIESSTHQVITWTATTRGPPRLEVTLPRSGFSFKVDLEDGNLLSREMSGFRVDPIQFTGTMLGLQNQLVLTRSPFNGLNDVERIVLIPRGDPLVHWSETTRHVNVIIQPPENISRIEYNIFRVDDLLGRLKFQGSPDIYARLQQVYLHAVTSICLPDPLTGQTGRETALQYLGGAGCFTFERLTSSEMNLLNLISDLSPDRSYYPENLRCMESVGWHPCLGFLSQDERYAALAERINLHRIRVETLSMGKVASSFSVRARSHLDARALVHQSLLNGSAYPLNAIDPTDRRHRARHSEPLSSPRIEDVVALSRMFSKKSPRRTVYASVLQNIYGELKKLKSIRETPGVDRTLATVKLQACLLSVPEKALLTIIDACRRVTPAKNSLLFTLGTLSYAETLGWSREQLSTIYAIAYLSWDGHALPMAPLYSAFKLSDGTGIDRPRIRKLIEQRRTNFYETTYAKMVQSSHESWQKYDSRRRSEYDAAITLESEQLFEHFTQQWILSQDPARPFDSSVFDMDRLVKDIKERFDSWRKNGELQRYSDSLGTCVRSHEWPVATHVNLTSSLSPDTQCPRQRSSSLFSLDHLLKSRDFGICDTTSLTSELQKSYSANDSGANRTQERVADALSTLPNDIENIGHAEIFRGYSNRLRESISALSTEPPSQRQAPADALSLVRRDYLAFQAKEREVYDRIVRVLAPRSTTEHALSVSGLWPSVTRTSVLGVLNFLSRAWDDTWRGVVASWAQVIIAFQMSRRRMTTAVHQELFAKDLASTQRGLCFDARYPDWLLLQIDADIAIRDVQHDIARTMIGDVAAMESLCLQLNMGEGKTSVIAPMVACAIANGERAPRIVVLKPLAAQMSQTICDRLAGLVNRRIYQLPFSRTTRLDNGALSLIEDMLKECVSNGGVLIAQPEHILSLKLRATGSLFPESDDFSSQELLQRIYRLLADNARDVLDESDEILHVRYQLVYTWGSCDHLQGHPDRWVTTQELLRLVASHLRRLAQIYPDAFISQGDSGGLGEKSFPSLRLLDAPPAAAAELVSSLVQDVLSGQLSAINTQHLSEDEKDAMRTFMSSAQISDPTRAGLSRMEAEKGVEAKGWNALLLMRGLLALGVLNHALGDKRYRVDYGLDPSRSQLAVPYRAKDVPATSAEFAHPDIIVLLTCLSYYLTGLDDSQIGHCIRMVGNLDEPETEYANWVSPAPGFSVPASLARLKGVNFDSAEQRRLICKLLRHNQSTIDFYLRSVVFPQEAKQFESRLACSAWDLVEPKRNITTGFSGTNDFQDLLPLHIIQRDPREQLSTNARVLNILLRPANDHYEQFSFPDGLRFIEHISAHKLRFRMVLDVGAQIPDLDNAALVRYWLLSCTHPDFAIAAIYVDASDRLTVLHRNGHEEPLSKSYINQPEQLSKCIVYLDEAHTRGIDLQLPAGFRAAVTLGPKVSKDRLVQGCMRLRRLSQGDHTVSFFGPSDVDRKIRRVARIPETSSIGVRHVLLWAISESCLEVNHRAVQWLYQGLDHKARRRPLDAFSVTQASAVADSPAQMHVAKSLREAWIQPEPRTVEEMYGLDASKTLDWFADTEGHPELRERALALGLSPGVSNEDAGTLLDEEQEREVAHEIEREQQIERPPARKAEKHAVDPALWAIVLTAEASKIGASHDAFLLAFSAFKYAAPSAALPDNWSGDLWATRDFFRTVQTDHPEREYFRPVHWVLSCPSTSHLRASGRVFVLVSPFEANELLPAIRESPDIRLHLFTPRVTLAMHPCDDLSLFTIPSEPDGGPPSAFPPSLRLQLILLSGQLYLQDYAQYIALCEMLGLYADDLAGTRIVARSDGFVSQSERAAKGVRTSALFSKTPVPALTSIMNIRRKGFSFDQTHIGKVLAGRRLFPRDFQVAGEMAAC